MSHREQLLAGARRCLVERGYAHTTARDIVAASGTNLGSIGYHFGSKEALLVEALNQALIEYTDKVSAAMTEAVQSGDPSKVVSTAWLKMISLMSDYRPLLVALIEAMAQAERNAELRQRLADGYEAIRRAGVRATMDAIPVIPESVARATTSFMMAVSDGILLQWLLDPERTPSGEDLLLGARLTLWGYGSEMDEPGR